MADIKDILDDYYSLNKMELVFSDKRYSLFQDLYHSLIPNHDETEKDVSYFYYVHKLNKLAKRRAFYCGVDLATFAEKLQKQHSFKEAFDINFLDKNTQGRFVLKRKIKGKNNINMPLISEESEVVDGYELIPIEKNMYSIFKAFVFKYIDNMLQEE